MRHSAAVTCAFLGLLAAFVRARPTYNSDSGRSLSSWSGWAPGTGMTMFASSSGDEDPWDMQPPPVWRMGEDGTPHPLERGPGGQADRKKDTPARRKHHRDQDDDDDYSDERGGSRANASFNAWFPILLGGGYPQNSDSSEGSVGSARGRPSSSSSPHRPPSSYPGSDERREGVAAVANSVNHGRSGVANSHAVIFAGEPEAFQQEARRRFSSRYFS